MNLQREKRGDLNNKNYQGSSHARLPRVRAPLFAPSFRSALGAFLLGPCYEVLVETVITYPVRELDRDYRPRLLKKSRSVSKKSSSSSAAPRSPTRGKSGCAAGSL